jgi:serine acetyltransferase
VIEGDVMLSAYAQVLGGVQVGRNAKIGAISVVLRDATAPDVPTHVVGKGASV